MEIYYHFVKFKIFLPIIKTLSFLFKNETNFQTNEFKYKVPKDYDPITKFLMKFNLYEIKERSLIKKMKDNLDIIEAGAGVGLISMYLKKKTKNNQLIMLEPNKKMNPIILDNFKINNFDINNLNILNYGLSDEDKKNIVFQKFESDMANTISNETLDYNLEKKETEFINTICVNSLIHQFKIQKFSIILDIEGEEKNVLTKNNDWMKFCEEILLENHLPKKELNKLNNVVINKGYKIIAKKENVFLFSKIIH